MSKNCFRVGVFFCAFVLAGIFGLWCPAPAQAGAEKGLNFNYRIGHAQGNLDLSGIFPRHQARGKTWVQIEDSVLYQGPIVTQRSLEWSDRQLVPGGSANILEIEGFVTKPGGNILRINAKNVRFRVEVNGQTVLDCWDDQNRLQPVQGADYSYCEVPLSLPADDDQDAETQTQSSGAGNSPGRLADLVNLSGYGDYMHMRLWISAIENKEKVTFRMGYDADDKNKVRPYRYELGELYTELPLPVLARSVDINYKNATVTVKRPYGVDLKDYEVYFAGQGGVTLWEGSVNLAYGFGNFYIREKTPPYSQWQLGTVHQLAQGLKIARRTPTTAELQWERPLYGAIKGYEVFRVYVGHDERFDTDGIVQTGRNRIDFATAGVKVGSIPNLTSFTDTGLAQDGLYAYGLRTVYYDGSVSGYTDPVLTDTVDMEGFPAAPTNLRLTSMTKTEVNLAWDAATPRGDEEFIIYRYSVEYTELANGTTWTTFSTSPKKLGVVKTKSFRDPDVVFGNEYTYLVQTKNGVGLSYPSPRLEIKIDLQDPTRPDNLQAGTVMMVNGKKEIVVPENPDTIFLGPEGEIGLTWDASTDDYKMEGYDIYRSADDPESDEKIKAGTTKETRFIITGLNPGTLPIYYVRARDKAGRTSEDRSVSFCVGPYLEYLEVKAGDEELPLSPDFDFRQTQYTAMQVENRVKSLTVFPYPVEGANSVVKINGNELPEGQDSMEVLIPVGKSKIVVTVTANGQTMAYTVTVDRANMADPPKIILIKGDVAQLNEGDTLQVEGLLNGTQGNWIGTVNFYDGTGPQPLKLNSANKFKFSRTYKDDGNYIIDLTFTLEDIGMVNRTIPVKVINVAPVIIMNRVNGKPLLAPASVVVDGPSPYAGYQSPPVTKSIGGEATVDEGTLFSLTGMVVDPGDDQWTLSATVEALEPQRQEMTAFSALPVAPDKTITFDHILYDHNLASLEEMARYLITFTVTDDEGAAGMAPVTVNVKDVVPAAKLGPPVILQKGEEFSREITVTDPGQDPWQALAKYEDETKLSILGDSGHDRLKLNHVYNETGKYNILVQVVSKSVSAGGITIWDYFSFSLPVTVKDYPLTVEAGEDIVLNEGEKLDRVLLINCPKDKIKNVTVDYGDGNGEQAVKPITVEMPGALSGSGTRDSFSMVVGWGLDHTFADNGEYTVKVKVTDIEGDSVEDSFTAEVENVAPRVAFDQEAISVYAGESFNLSGSVTDVPADILTVLVDFEDGRGESPLELNSDYTFELRHSYSSSGNYTITVKGLDDDEGEGSAALTVNVQRKWQSSGGGSAYHQEPSSIADLRDLQIFNGSGTPIPLYQNGDTTRTGFSADCLQYSILESAASFAASPADSGASMAMYDGNSGGWAAMLAGENFTGFWFNNSGDTIDLGNGGTLGENEAVIRVTAEDGTTVNYYKVKWESGESVSSNADLSSLQIFNDSEPPEEITLCKNGVPANEGFSADCLNYSIFGRAASFAASPADSGASMAMYDGNSGEWAAMSAGGNFTGFWFNNSGDTIDLGNGGTLEENEAVIRVTAEDGTTIKYYKVKEE